jgi:hypothetical protein
MENMADIGFFGKSRVFALIQGDFKKHGVAAHYEVILE